VAGDVWNLKIVGRGFHDQAQTGAGIDERRHGAEAFFLLGEIMDGIHAEPPADIPNIAPKVDLISGGTKHWLWRGFHAPSFPIS